MSLNIKPASPAPDLRGATRADQVRLVQEWFFENFEDPVHNTPYETREGGYQYIWGGPYDARDEIGSSFYYLREDVLEEAIGTIEDDGSEWAPNDGRIFDEDTADPSPYAALQKALDDVEKSLTAVRPVSPAIGGNNPPEDIGVPPYTDEDELQIKSAIEALREPEQALMASPQLVEQSGKSFQLVSQKLLDFFKRQGLNFTDAFSAELGKRAAQLLAGSTAVWALTNSLINAAEAVRTLLAQLPF